MAEKCGQGRDVWCMSLFLKGNQFLCLFFSEALSRSKSRGLALTSKYCSGDTWRLHGTNAVLLLQVQGASK